MTTAEIARLFDVTVGTLRRNTDGLTHEDSLVQPSPAGNCLNWVLGHIVATRERALALVGEPAVWGDGEGARYEQGSRPLERDEPVLTLREILSALEASHERLGRGLQRAEDSRLPADALALLHFHEAYHAGQVGLLRRIAGKPGAI